MNFAFLPDLLALMILIVILMLLRQRHPQERADLWLLGLFFTLVEAVAHTFYAQGGPPQKILHVIVMDCYLLTGMIFVWASGVHPVSTRSRLLFLSLNTLPLMAICTIYGLHLNTGLAYFPCMAAGMVIGVCTSLYLRRNWQLALAHVCGWMAMGYLIHLADFRSAVYWSLCCVYATAAMNFQRRLPRGSTGRLAIVTGFTIWSLCLLLHPWIVQYRAYADIASHIWNMQKWLISIGMILVMLEEQISSNEWLALHDELTGLPNRRLFADRLTTAIERADRTRSRVALIILDLDGFKRINDTMGHQAGDQVLREISSNLRKGVRASDTLARLGGDEFIIVATDMEQERSLNHFADTVRRAMERPIVMDGKMMVVTASVGMAVYPDDAEDSIRLLRVADQRMYALKHRPGAQASKGVSGLTAAVVDSHMAAVAGRRSNVSAIR
ncbi:GGDEF domain-containing protein [Granulicella sp. S190]|uniref:GGDEF domain-containing protein n=1 Tax=Granulicella sp. S190 TaxID=1747226 RepID=UPI00131E01CA|nr:GGDEF domain-containing protein [Granulicella sp. S190]